MVTMLAGGQPWLIPGHKQMIVGAKVKNAGIAIDCAYDELGIPKVPLLLQMPRDLNLPQIMSAQDLTNPAVDELRYCPVHL
jgi:hypothetical protein